ncbi:hypothetical protein OH76DRAFT_489936 [Lentinus brumalis]|uniref:Uncharacterized protein n=1 Tax=Lentinus brumalis TaxID=2498619 RepID=A0A371CI15_9APHY|nr:hypothetical protein OH76DRAFT_489936 [Polyporus brumalis]
MHAALDSRERPAFYRQPRLMNPILTCSASRTDKRRTSAQRRKLSEPSRQGRLEGASGSTSYEASRRCMEARYRACICSTLRPIRALSRCQDACLTTLTSTAVDNVRHIPTCGLRIL